MPRLDPSELERFTLYGQLANGGTMTVTLCPNCYDLHARKADRLGHKDGVTDITPIRSRRHVANECFTCGRKAESP